MPDFASDFGQAFNANSPVAAGPAVAAAAPGLVFDKLTIINNALIATANNTCVTDDGTNEWTVGSNAYDRMLPVVMSRRNWRFQRQITTLNRLGVSAFPGFADVFALPSDSMYIINAWDTLDGANVSAFRYGVQPGSTRAPDFEYKIIAAHVHCNGPNGVTAEYIKTPNSSDPLQVLFVQALTTEIESIIVRALNEDIEAARDLKKLARIEMQEAASRDDQQQPARIAFRSKMLERRRGYFYGSR